MPFFVKARSFLPNLFLSRHADTNLDQEVHAHLELLTEENIRAGMPPTEAQRVVRIELGGIEQVKEQVREERIGNWLRSVISDCRYGLRQLRKNPGFTAVAVLTLALGIAVNATMFSLVSAFLLQRPPGREPERVAVVTSVNPARRAEEAFPDTEKGWSAAVRTLPDFLVYAFSILSALGIMLTTASIGPGISPRGTPSGIPA
jgi:hypothetical protein